MESQRFSLRWDGFRDTISALLDQLRGAGELLDVTLCCDGHQVRAHRLVLSMCSPYFRQVLKSHPCQHLVLFLRDTPAADLSALLEFMYRGSVDVRQAQLASFIRTAELLQIRGLSGEEDKPEGGSPVTSPRHVRVPSSTASPLTKRPRLADPATPLAGSGFGAHSGSSGRLGSVGSSGSGFGSGVNVATTPSRSQSQDTQRNQSSQSQADRLRGLDSTGEKEPKSGQEEYSRHQADRQEQYPDWYPEDNQERHQERLKHERLKQERLKQEPIDLTEDDDDVDGTPGPAAAGEVTFGEPPKPAGSTAGVTLPRFRPLGSQVPLTSAAGWQLPSSNKVAAPAPRGSASRELHTCHICLRRYKRRDTLLLHVRKHQGLTTCGRCGKVLPTRSDLRRHLVRDHELSREQTLLEAPPIGSATGAYAAEAGRQTGFENRTEAGIGSYKSGVQSSFVHRSLVDRTSGYSAVEGSFDGSGLDSSAVDAGGLDLGEVDTGVAVDESSVDVPGVDEPGVDGDCVDGVDVDGGGQAFLGIPKGEEFEIPGDVQ